ncbi:MAG: phage portal protein, partial [Geminicoccaceae bacterium]
ADAELGSSQQTLRSRSRALVRDAAFAKRARNIVVNNVNGSGVGLQADVRTTRDTLNESVNEAIEETFKNWCRADSCHTGGVMHFADIERAAFGNIFEAGEVLIRKHRRPFGAGNIPLALELIEPERLADNYIHPSPVVPGAQIRMGVEVDSFYRPIAYWIRVRHPGETSFTNVQVDKLERVPAEDVFHLRIVDRWPQTRGEPWMHAVIRKLNDIDGYTEAEIVAARSAASYMGFIESDAVDDPNTEVQEDGSLQTELSPGIIDKLRPGEKFNFAAPNRPNSNAESFLRFMLREMAAGASCSYESLSRDYSQSNYSSSRLALIDDRDAWRALQLWWIRTFRMELHREWLQSAVLARAIPGVSVDQYMVAPEKFEAASFKPRGWSWIDPTKEVEAYKEAVKAGFTTVTDVIAQTGNGQDIEDVLEQRERELKAMEEKDLVFDTSPEVYVKEEAGPPPPEPKPPKKDDESDDSKDPPRRVLSFGGKR